MRNYVIYLLHHIPPTSSLFNAYHLQFTDLISALQAIESLIAEPITQAFGKRVSAFTHRNLFHSHTVLVVSLTWIEPNNQTVPGLPFHNVPSTLKGGNGWIKQYSNLQARLKSSFKLAQVARCHGNATNQPLLEPSYWIHVDPMAEKLWVNTEYMSPSATEHFFTLPASQYKGVELKQANCNANRGLQQKLKTDLEGLKLYEPWKYLVDVEARPQATASDFFPSPPSSLESVRVFEFKSMLTVEGADNLRRIDPPDPAHSRCRKGQNGYGSRIVAMKLPELKETYVGVGVGSLSFQLCVSASQVGGCSFRRSPELIPPTNVQQRELNKRRAPHPEHTGSVIPEPRAPMAADFPFDSGWGHALPCGCFLPEASGNRGLAQRFEREYTPPFLCESLLKNMSGKRIRAKGVRARNKVGTGPVAHGVLLPLIVRRLPVRLGSGAQSSFVGRFSFCVDAQGPGT
ncbi:hypothetical protein C8F04DRAFT_1181001 [Mycena alexandri]|uniref:Uncharacterized protein n=1 Tax=Mycena alexandri TaxID=1745969 RepID=A0AAD6T208_9AGAR|nr:hypothetical protein C8F04DRAFT_1181001 [Mycena alexandri]